MTLALLPLFLFTGCGDLAPEMQDTRTVMLKMDLRQNSSLRRSQVSAADLSAYNTHLIMVLPSSEQLSNNYRNYYHIFAEELMDPESKQVSLEIPLNTQLKIFAFLFKENYSKYDLFSAIKEVGYYGESPRFSIDGETNNLSLAVSLIPVSGTDTGTDTETDTTAPVLTEVYPVTTPTSSNTPEYTFKSTEAGTISYGGSCSSARTAAVSGDNIITFNTLTDGTYSDCTITVTDSAGNISNPLSVTDFTVDTTSVDTTAPVLTEVYPVTTPTSSNTPEYTFKSTEAGTISYGGSCSSARTAAVSGDNIITFNTLTDGTYSDCTITVTDSEEIISNILSVTTFIVETSSSNNDTTAPVLTEVYPVTSPTSSTTPEYTFNSTEAGTISYGGLCSSARTAAVSGDNIITFNTLTDGTYSDCTITVTDSEEIISNILSVTTFIVETSSSNNDTTAPVLTEVTAVPDTTSGNPLNYTFSSTEAGSITYGEDCSSSTNNATKDNNTITFNTLSTGTYSNCTITVMDNVNNMSAPLAVSSFTVTSSSSDTTKPQITDLSFSPSSIDTSSSSQTVTATISITDDTALPDSGGSNFYIRLMSPSQNQFIDFTGYEGSEETGGTSVSRTFKSTSTFSQGSESGTWTVSYASVKDLVGNTKSYTASELTTLGFSTTISNTHSSSDTTVPTLSSVSIASNNSTSTLAAVGDNVTLSFTASETISTPVVTFLSGGAAITDTSFTYVNTSENTWTAVYTTESNDTTGSVAYSIAFSDSAGNAGTAVTSGSGSVTFDKTAPTVSLVTTTADNQSSISITDNITVTFSEAMEPSYVTTSTSDINCAGNIMVSSDNFSNCVKMSSDPASSNSNMTFTLDPYDNLTVGTTYKIRVTTGVKDTAGNALSSQYETSSGFTPADLIAPTVYSIYPVDNQSSVLVSDNISLTFSEIMDNSSITTNTDNTSCYGSFQVSSDNFSTCVLMSSSPSISNSAKTFTFDPSDNLSYDNKYNIKLTTETKDENGVSLESAYETSFNTIDNSLVAYYPFNGNAEDITSNGRDLTVTGDTSLTFGKDNSSNSAYYFDGNGDYLEYVTNIPSFDNYTISLWAKPDSSGTYKAMFSSYDDSGRGFQIDLDGSNFHIRKSSGGNIVLSTAQLEVWTFIAFTYDGTNSIAYINSVRDNESSGGTTEFNRFRIGRNRSGSTYFSGAIDELRIYNRALTASEIASLYAN